VNVLTVIITAILNAIKNFLLGMKKEEIVQFHDKALVWQEESSKRRRTRMALWAERVKSKAHRRKACRRWKQLLKAGDKYERRRIKS